MAFSPSSTHWQSFSTLIKPSTTYGTSYFCIKLRASFVCMSVWQGSVLGPFLYTHYTADIPVSSTSIPSAKRLGATYVDDTAMLASHLSLQTAANAVQELLDDIEVWAAKWNTAINGAKSVTFAVSDRHLHWPNLQWWDDRQRQLPLLPGSSPGSNNK